MEHGIHVAISSDILPIGPLVGICAAVTRKGMPGTVFGAEEALSGCTPMQHALTQFPYALIAASITIAGFLMLAYV